ncbi:TAAR5 [Branchiostoma lanceolatum]|uniref:TAAR5 protein n=1 Tax=Branchiostoma lanceolatum TaxID=7740 RepID=A0A8K0EQD0_BRALA|nr:TAAR5 [Branchiostoma lanceolatum]
MLMMDDNGTNSSVSTVPFYVAYGVQGFISVIGLLANAFIIFLLGRYPGVRSVANVYVGNLAVADLGFCLYSLVQTPLSVLEEDPGRGNENDSLSYQRGCDVGRVLAILLASASVYHLTAIAVERHHAITDPMDHLQRSTVKKALRTCLVLWAAAFLTAALDTVIRNGTTQHWNFTAQNLFECVFLKHLGTLSSGTNPLLILAILIFVMTYVAPACVMIPLYVRVFREVQKSTRFAAREFRNDRQAVRMVVVVTVFFLVCWLPFHVTSVVIASLGYHGDEEALHACWAFGLVNSAANPFLYALLGRKFRAQIQVMLSSAVPCKRKDRQRQGNATQRDNTTVSQSETTYL